MQYRPATADDVPILAAMNHRLIRDEGHRNDMSIAELEQRMRDWLADGGYEGVLFDDGGVVAGYALFRREAEWVYLRQLFVTPEKRRTGIGASAMKWLLANTWAYAPRVRIDVLVQNSAGIEFWRAVGFADYCITMELDR
jgi:GNAT superfamily N-acetyltransferase